MKVRYIGFWDAAKGVLKEESATLYTHEWGGGKVPNQESKLPPSSTKDKRKKINLKKAEGSKPKNRNQ